MGRPSTERLMTTVMIDAVKSVAIIVTRVAGAREISVDRAESVAWRRASAPVAFGSTEVGSGSR
ncbi:hypothetical protein M2436_002725 [Streptomyces sp. HB372]|nr:hypothetical protein [Streptomyces sp. HB372]